MGLRRGEGYHRSAGEAGQHRLRTQPLQLHAHLHEHAAIHEAHHASGDAKPHSEPEINE